MLSRRDLLSSAAALALVPALSRASMPDDVAKLDALMDAIFQENLRRNPEGATQLGFDKGPNADLKSKLRDESRAGKAATKAEDTDQLRRILAIDAGKLDGLDRVNYETIRYTKESAVAVGAFDFGGQGSGPSPYVVSQQTGAYQSIPDFLDTKHRIETAADADAYLARLDAFAGQLDDNTEQMRHDAGLGVVPPDFLLDLALTQLAATRTTADKSLLVTSIAHRAKEKGLSDDYAKRAAALYDAKIGPALDRQIDEAKKLRATAAHDAGVWHVKQGGAFYASALRSTTTTGMSPDDIHQFGLDQGKDIAARIDVLLQNQGMSKGTIGERILALYQ